MKSSLVLLVSGLCTTGCEVQINSGSGIRGSGVMAREARQIPPFSSIHVLGACDVEIRCQETQKVELEGDDNILPLIETEVQGSTLTVRSRESYSTRRRLVARISVPDIQKIVVSGAGDIVVSAIANGALAVTVSGAGDAVLTGRTERLDVHVSGAGDVVANELVASEVVVGISGAGTVSVYASERLHAEISGAGELDYYGNPRDVRKSVSGAGSVRKR